MEEKAVLQFDLLGTFAGREKKSGQAASFRKNWGKRPCHFYNISS
jgi:hypothetical protein